MKPRTKQSLMKRANNHIFIVLSLVLSMGIGLGTVTAQVVSPRAYVANSVDNTVTVIDTATNAVVATIPVSTGPFGVAVTPDGTRAYVTNGSSPPSPPTLSSTSVDIRELIQNLPGVSVIDTATNTVIATIPVGLVPFGVAITPDGTRAYVTNEDSNTVSVIDIATNTVVATIPVGVAPSGIAITRVPQAPTRRGRRCVSGQEWASWFAQTARTPSTATGIARSVVVIGTRTR